MPSLRMQNAESYKIKNKLKTNMNTEQPEIPKEDLPAPVSVEDHPVIERSKFFNLLLRRGIKLREIQEATGISYPTLIDLSKGRKKKYRPRTLRDIAAYLDVSVSDIIDESINTNDDVTPFEKILKDRNLKVQDVADATGISYPILQDIKNGKQKNYRERTLRDVATYLDVNPGDLLPKFPQTANIETDKDNKLDESTEQPK